MSTANRPTGPTILAWTGNTGRPWIRTTYQLSSAYPASPATIDAKFEEACKTVLRWVKGKNRLPGPLPQSGWDGQSFRLEWPGQKVELIAIPEEGIWSFRLEHPDMPFMDQPAIPGRTWTTDIALTKRKEVFFVGVRIFCASLPYGDAEVSLTRPKIVVDLANRPGLMDLRSLSQEPWMLNTEQDLKEFRSFLVDKRRSLPVVVLTQPDRTRFDVSLSDYVLDPVELAKRTIGLAHIVQMPWELGYKWTEMVGKLWSVFLGAVRTYMPSLDLQTDPPFWHPSTFAEKIVFWKQPNDNRVGEGPFTDFLVERLHQFAATRRIEWGGTLFLSEARTRQAEVARRKASETSDWKMLYEEQIGALETKIKELEQEAGEYSDDALRTAKERDAYKDENRQLRFQVDTLRQALSERTGGKSETDIHIPDNYDDMCEWAAKYLIGRVVLHPRALRGLKDANYEDVRLVYRSLLILANEYRNQCLGRQGGKDAFEMRIAALSLRFAPSISKERAGEQGEDYYVRFPTQSSPRRFLDWHLRKGSTKDDRYCLAIYFFWDDNTQQVVVGWLPSHLDNRMT